MANESTVAFLKTYFSDFVPSPPETGDIEGIEKVMLLVAGHFEKAKRPARYVLGLAIDFLLQAQALSSVDADLSGHRPELTEEGLFERYTLVTERAGQVANTLTLTFGGTSVGIRKFEEAVKNYFHAQKRGEYPSAYVYNTGQWQKYKTLLVACFSLSTNGRYLAVKKLLEYGLTKLKENEFFGRKSSRVNLFERIISDYPRGSDNENGGVVFQAIANGFFIADRPHLCIISAGVRTGSARQKRIGDIDCYKVSVRVRHS